MAVLLPPCSVFVDRSVVLAQAHGWRWRGRERGRHGLRARPSCWCARARGWRGTLPGGTSRRSAERRVRHRVALQPDGGVPALVQRAHGDPRQADERPQLVVRPVEDRRDARRRRPPRAARGEHAPARAALVRPPDAREERLDAAPLDQREEPLLERAALHGVHPEPVRRRRLRDKVVNLAERLAVADVRDAELREQRAPVPEQQRQQVEDDGAVLAAVEAEAELLRAEIRVSVI